MDPAETYLFLQPASVCFTSQRERRKSHSGLCSALTGAWQLVCGSAYECHPSPFIFPHDFCMIAALLCSLQPKTSTQLMQRIYRYRTRCSWGGGGGEIFFNGERKTLDACCYALRGFNSRSQFTEGSSMPGRDLWVGIWRFTFLKAPSLESSLISNLSFALFAGVSIWAKKKKKKIPKIKSNCVKVHVPAFGLQSKVWQNKYGWQSKSTKVKSKSF